MTEVRDAVVVAVLAILALAPARGAAQGATCSGTLTGGIEASFDCTVEARREGDRVRFVVTPSAPIPGVKALRAGTYGVRTPLAVRTYRGDELTGDGPAVTASRGGVARASVGRARHGDVQLSIEQVEREANGRTLAAASVRAKLAPAGKKGKPSSMELRFTTVW